MSINVGLVGNPNSGKTTMFNELTGSKQYVGNWPGVTVEKKEGFIKHNKNIKIIDLPGVYSLSPYTIEEVITRDYLINEKPDVIINIIDASNIERNLYLTTQILEMEIPVIIALNMIDIVEKMGDKIDKEKLSKELGCPVIETTALRAKGLSDIAKIINDIDKDQKMNNLDIFSEKLEDIIIQIETILNIEDKKRWFATKIFEKDEKVYENLNISDEDKTKIHNLIFAIEQELEEDSDSIIINERYLYITELVSRCVSKNKNPEKTISQKIDDVVTNRILALPIFVGVMFMVYYISVSTLGAFVTDWTNDVFFGEYVVALFGSMLESINASTWVVSLVIDGIIGGVGAILGFVPQMAILFLLLALLEDCGYMSRVAFIMDRVFRKFGLSGKSFIPLIVGTGCSVPGIMAARTIENPNDRKITVFVTSFIPCGAKLPIIALFAAALFPKNPFIGPSVYFLGILMVIISGVILKKMKAFAGEASPFVMEMPNYHLPSPRSIFIHVWDRLKAFIIKAGTVIFIFSIIMWFTSNFDFSLQMVEPNDSILAAIGGLIAPIFAPLGFGNWQSAVATFNGLVAKENLVSTFGVLFGFGEGDAGLLEQIEAMFTTVSAFSFVMFNMLCAPCFAAIGAIKRELGSVKFTLMAVLYQTLVAYSTAYIIYNIGNAIVLEQYNYIGITISVLIITTVLFLMFKPNKYKVKTS